MSPWRALSAGIAIVLMLWAGTALTESRPECDQQARMKTPEKADGTIHEFQASTETLRDLKAGGRVKAKLREVPNC